MKYFKTLVIDLDLNPFDRGLSVRRIKKRIEALEGYPPELQQLTHDGRVLGDDFIIDESIDELDLSIGELALENVAPPRCSVS